MPGAEENLTDKWYDSYDMEREGGADKKGAAERGGFRRDVDVVFKERGGRRQYEFYSGSESGNHDTKRGELPRIRENFSTI